MKHIMIPTDFSVRSLNLVRYAVNHFEDEQIKITLLHFMELPGSITDLLMLPREASHRKLINAEFRDGMCMLKNRYASQVVNISPDFLIGATTRMLKNYLRANQVDAIVFPENYELKMPSKRSLNPAGMIRRSKWQILSVKVDKPATPSMVQEESVAALLVAAY